jgi:hypothetical protein
MNHRKKHVNDIPDSDSVAGFPDYFQIAKAHEYVGAC